MDETMKMNPIQPVNLDPQILKKNESVQALAIEPLSQIKLNSTMPAPMTR